MTQSPIGEEKTATTTTKSSEKDVPVVPLHVELRDYFAAHCPLTVMEGWRIWTSDSGVTDFMVDQQERDAFWQWYALMRGEYADAQIAEREKDRG